MSDKYEESNGQQKSMILRAALGKDAEKEEFKDAIEYVYEILRQDILDEYLVDGAMLKCEKASEVPRYIGGQCFCTNRGVQSPLVVNRKANIGGSSYANISDTRKSENIFPFGNCIGELTKAEEEWLNRIPEAKSEGICKYLMQLCKCWDIFPRGMDGYFNVNGYPAINMQARLFCYSKGAFIYPVTSGQKIVRYGYEDTPLFAMNIDDVLFAYKNNFNQKQMIIFLKIQQYFEAIPDLKDGNVIFAFEGLGNEYDDSVKNGNKEIVNDLHPSGQFNALFVLYKEGKITYAMGEGSTLPDRKNNAIIRDGVYSAVYWNHKGKYAALQLRVAALLDEDKIHDESLERMMNENLSARGAGADKDDIPALRYAEIAGQPSNSASGINLHMARKISKGSNWSIGCLTVDEKEYYNFGVAAGFIDEQPDQDTKDYQSYNNIEYNIYTSHYNENWGYVVVDRSCMEEDEKVLFFESDE